MRYMDDIFLILIINIIKYNINNIIKLLKLNLNAIINNLYPDNIIITTELNPNNIIFLNGIFYKFNNIYGKKLIYIKSYEKEGNLHCFPHFKSNHSLAMKKSIVYGLFYTSIITNSLHNNHLVNIKKIVLYLNRRGYYNYFIRLCNKPSWKNKNKYFENTIYRNQVKSLKKSLKFAEFHDLNSILINNLTQSLNLVNLIDEFHNDNKKINIFFKRLFEDEFDNDLQLNNILKKFETNLPSSITDNYHIMLCTLVNKNIGQILSCNSTY